MAPKNKPPPPPPPAAAASKVLVIEGVGFFFPCGHGYVKAVDPAPRPGAAAVETGLVCPRCTEGECLSCGGVFSGRWCDFCALCAGFWNFAAWADYAVASGAGRVRFAQGLIVVPAVPDEGAEEAVRSPWPDLLTLAEGDVELRLKNVVGYDGDDDDEGLAVDASVTLTVKDQVDHRGKQDTSRIGQKITWTLCDVDCDVNLGSDEIWPPPEPTTNFSWFQEAEDEQHGT